MENQSQKPAKVLEEIEITPEMIEAGAIELRKHVSGRFVLSDEEVVDFVLGAALSIRSDHPSPQS